VSPIEGLTPRQRQAVALLAAGVSRDEAARSMQISRATLDEHLRVAYLRLGVESLVQAMNVLGWVDVQ
jgi:DNA-binding CsgD family transcriptional regulator